MGIEEGTIRKDYIPKIFRTFKVARRTELLVEISRRGIRIPRPGSDSAARWVGRSPLPRADTR